MAVHGSALDFVVAPRSKFYHGPFGRLFSNLEPFHTSDEELQTIAQTMVNRPESTDNTSIPAGYTYFGQFVDHDITFDPTSQLMRFNDPNKLRNFRTPRFDLDSIYGCGPAASPFLYDQDPEESKGFYLLTGKGVDVGGDQSPTDEDDLSRNSQGKAIIGDPRNDENILVSQVQLLFIKFHNRVMDYLRDVRGIADAKERFPKAQQLVRWHYQWVVINDFLKKIAGPNRVERLFPEKNSGRELLGSFRLLVYNWKHQPYIPVEFSVAAYRLGHSMVRSQYELNDKLTALAGEIPIFSRGAGPLQSLGGGRPLPKIWSLQWDRFLDFGEKTPQFSKKLNASIARPLGDLPDIPNTSSLFQNLAFRNLKRGVQFELPSGQTVARALGLTPKASPRDGTKEDPLWFYILNEADRDSAGEKLGPVGGNIVAEVFVGLLAGDPQSYINVDPEWQPLDDFRINPEDDDFQLRDIVNFTGMPVTEI